MMTTIFRFFKVLNLKQLFRDIDYWFWFLMLTTVGLSWAVVNTGAAFADAAQGVRMLTAQHRAAPPSPEVSAAYLAVKGAALGAKYKERGVKRADLESTLDYLLETGQINLTYKNAILGGYDKGLRRSLSE
jgi:hypothetical protein